MSNAVRTIQQLGQAIWMDYISRDMLTSGELIRLIELGVVGVTSNPTILEKAIVGTAGYDADLQALAAQGRGSREVYEELAAADIRTAADLLRPTHTTTDGRDGYVSLEVDPSLARDTRGTIEEATRLFATLERPNVFIKVPATTEGIPAVRALISRGVNVNVTLIFSREVYRLVREAYVSGLEEFIAAGGDPGKVASVASFFVSRVDTAVDSLLKGRPDDDSGRHTSLLGKAAVANAKLAYQDFKETFEAERFQELKRRGARVQRPLWASTSTKEPGYSDLLYVEPLIGRDTVNTMPPATLDALLDHGVTAPTLEEGVDDARATADALRRAGITMEEVTQKLLADGVKSFADSYDNLLANIQNKIAELDRRVGA